MDWLGSNARRAEIAALQTELDRLEIRMGRVRMEYRVLNQPVEDREFIIAFDSLMVGREFIEQMEWPKNQTLKAQKELIADVARIIRRTRGFLAGDYSHWTGWK